MKTEFRKLLLLTFTFLSVLSISSCVGEGHIKHGEGDEIRFQVTLGGEEAAAKSANALRAKPVDPTAPATSVMATEAEKYITTDQNCIAFLFHADSKAFVKYVEFSRPQGSSAPFTLKPGIKGNFVMKLVFNLNETDYNNLKNLKVGTTRQLDDALVTTPLHDGSNGAHFVMTSDYVNVNNASGNVTLSGAIQLHRLAARIDIENHFRNLIINKVIVENRYTQSLLGIGDRNGMPKDKNLNLAASTEYQFPAGSELLSSTIYTYENLNTDAKNLKITIEGTFKGKAIKTSFALKNTPVKRNHIYHINIEKNAADFYEPIEHNITVAEWKDGAVLDIPSNTIVNNENGITIDITLFKKKTDGSGEINYGTAFPQAQDVQTIELGRRRTVVRFDVTSTSATTRLVCTTAKQYIPSELTIRETKAAVMENGKTIQQFEIYTPACVSIFDQTLTYELRNAVTGEVYKTINLHQPRRPELPIEHMAMYNMMLRDSKCWMIDPRIKNFDKNDFRALHPGSDVNEVFNFYNNSTSISNRSDPKYTYWKIVADDGVYVDVSTQYHEPEMEEWLAIIPAWVPKDHYFERTYKNTSSWGDYDNPYYRFNFGHGESPHYYQPDINCKYDEENRGILESFVMYENGVRKEFNNYGTQYLNVAKGDLGTVYALRYMKESDDPEENNLYMCAMRYDLRDRTDKSGNPVRYLLISCHYLGPDYDLIRAESGTYQGKVDPFSRVNMDKIKTMEVSIPNFWNPRYNPLNPQYPKSNKVGDTVIARILSLTYKNEINGKSVFYQAYSSFSYYNPWSITKCYTVWMDMTQMSGNHVHSVAGNNDSWGLLRVFSQQPQNEVSEEEY